MRPPISMTSIDCRAAAVILRRGYPRRFLVILVSSHQVNTGLGVSPGVNHAFKTNEKSSSVLETNKHCLKLIIVFSSLFPSLFEICGTNFNIMIKNKFR